MTATPKFDLLVTLPARLRCPQNADDLLGQAVKKHQGGVLQLHLLSPVKHPTTTTED